MNHNIDYKDGVKNGMPIGIGYFGVSMAFGMMVKNALLPIEMAVFISATNLTSAGQFAGLNLIVMNASMMEIAFTTFIINLRYALMSLSLSQRVDEKMSRFKRMILAFGITDEIYAVSLTKEMPLTLSYFLGLLTPAYIGWVLGSFMGALLGSLLPEAISDAMNIALYGMFVAIILPQAKKDRHKALAIVLSVALSCIFAFVPSLHIGSGWMIIIITIVVSAFMALAFPIRKDEI